MDDELEHKSTHAEKDISMLKSDNDVMKMNFSLLLRRVNDLPSRVNESK